jgi:hypothetical protein
MEVLSVNHVQRDFSHLLVLSIVVLVLVEATSMEQSVNYVMMESFQMVERVNDAQVVLLRLMAHVNVMYAPLELNQLATRQLVNHAP